MTGLAADKYGRKPVLYSAYIFLCVGTAIQVAAQSPTMCGKFLLGFVCSINGTAAPLLLAKTAYPLQRSIVSSLYMTGFYVGAIIAAWTVFGTLHMTGDWAWRFPTILQLLCPVALFILSSESPRWLIAVGRVEEAQKFLTDIHARGDASSPLVQFEFADITRNINSNQEAQQSSSYKEMIRTAPNIKRLFITVTLGILSQWVGNGVVSYYLALVLETAGITKATDPILISAGLQM